MKIRIATRKSKLALFQAEYVANQIKQLDQKIEVELMPCLLYTSPSPRDRQKSRMPSSA